MIQVGRRTVLVAGRFPRLASVRSEFFDPLKDPAAFLKEVNDAAIPADVFTFLDPSPDAQYPYVCVPEKKSVLKLGTYENWWKNQVNDKTRNMVRKASKKGVELRIVEFDDDLVRGIKEIHDETPIRQGRRFRHFGKDLATVRAEHGTFVEQSDFIGAFLGDELIGFAKLVHRGDASILMQILSKLAHRDKAAMNALLAKAVEICTERGVPELYYGTWARRGLGAFRKHNAFECATFPRFYVPLNARGRLCLRLHLHRPFTDRLAERIPEKHLNSLANLRGRWYAFRYRKWMRR
jgi:hypothetical protein